MSNAFPAVKPKRLVDGHTRATILFDRPAVKGSGTVVAVIFGYRRNSVPPPDFLYDNDERLSPSTEMRSWACRGKGEQLIAKPSTPLFAIG